ncbi:MAG: transglycosylase SLT domain-containing protein [Acidobacteria bacterium]|nr:transglycosylase SLT domain-containing protein [Acidobacteriota bacterium]
MLRKQTFAIILLIILTLSCSGQQSEEQALARLREITSTGKMPPEAMIADIETRFANKRSGALARLLHAKMKLDANDPAGAAALLNSKIFNEKTKVADHALWLRGKALQAAGDNAGALEAFDKLLHEYPNSVRVRDSKLSWAAAAIAAGRAVEVPPFLVQMSTANDPDALLLTAKAYEAQNSIPEAIGYYRRTYFAAARTPAAAEAAAKLTSLGQPLTPANVQESLDLAMRLFSLSLWADAANAFASIPESAVTANDVRLAKVTAFSGAARMVDAQKAFAAMPMNSLESEEASRQLVLGYAKARQWPQARTAADEMRQRFPQGKLTAKTFIDAGLAARDARMRTEETYFLSTALNAFPNSVDVAQAQFEAAWLQHEAKNFAASSQMLIEHLARYADKDTTNRGKAGYWAARDSERAGKTAEACALYDAVIYRYGANWYGYLASGRLAAMKAAGQCRATTPPNDTIVRAAANLKTVTVAAESAGPRELERAEKGDELSIIGLFDWAIDELKEAKRTADKSPKINLALARHYRWKGDNTSALIAMQKSYPDYAQMFPEEMGREEWAFFYPLTNWADIQKWAVARGLDRYQVAGFIRQETIFSPRAKSSANAYGLMQLLLPTARAVARKYGLDSPASAEDLYNPALNIELGTAYLKDQFDKFGRVEYVAVAYNAGPGRVPQWRASLPAEIDEFAENIPFKETKQYVQGIIRNTAQYRRLYDDNGNFRANVGTRPLRGEIDTLPSDQFTAQYPEVVLDRSTE